MILAAFAVPAVLVYIASTNTGSIRLFGLVRLSPPQANSFFWSLACLCLAAAGVALWVAVQNHRGPGYVELQLNAAILPQASLSRRTLRIPYSSIQSVSLVQVTGQPMLIVKSPVGESRLLARGFASEQEFNAFCRSLRERAGG